MTVEQFREMIHANPFVPFSIRLADGRTIRVVHTDYVSSSESGRIVHVFHGPGDASTFVDLLLVTAFEMNPGTAPTSPA